MTSEMDKLRYVREGDMSDPLEMVPSMQDIVTRDWRARAEAAEAKCARLEKALQFYADESTWRVPDTGGWSQAGVDQGRKARAALPDTAQPETGK
ncbi:MAG: hypothetical protein ACR2RE_04540 [Geminicoccaceae bacterium]